MKVIVPPGVEIDLLVDADANYDQNLYNYVQDGTTVTVSIQISALNDSEVCVAFAHGSNCTEIKKITIQGILDT